MIAGQLTLHHPQRSTRHLKNRFSLSWTRLFQSGSLQDSPGVTVGPYLLANQHDFQLRSHFIVVSIAKQSDFIKPGGIQMWTITKPTCKSKIPLASCLPHDKGVKGVQEAAKRYIRDVRVPNITPNYFSKTTRLAQQWDRIRSESSADKWVHPLSSRINRVGDKQRRKKLLDH